MTTTESNHDISEVRIETVGERVRVTLPPAPDANGIVRTLAVIYLQSDSAVVMAQELLQCARTAGWKGSL